MAEVFLSPTAIRELERLPTAYRQAVKGGIDALARAPTSGKRVRGDLAGLLSKRVGDYRIIYEFDPRAGRVLVHWVRHRSRAYR